MEDQRIAHIALDEKTTARRSPQVEHERKVAIYDLLEENFFAPVMNKQGPFHLHLSNVEGRLIFDVRNVNEVKLLRISVPAAFKTMKSVSLDGNEVLQLRYFWPKEVRPRSSRKNSTGAFFSKWADVHNTNRSSLDWGATMAGFG